MRNHAVRTMWLFAVLAVAISGCASSPSYLQVTYTLPDASRAEAGKSLALKVITNIDKDSLIGPNAADDLKNFTGLFSVSVAGKHAKPVLIGAYDVAGMFQTAFAERLSAAGIRVVTAPAGDTPVLDVRISEFRIDRDGRQWVASLAYEASVVSNGEPLTSQRINGTAERMKVVGTGDAEKLLGDIVTSMVNRLDMALLFDHPKL